MRIEFIANYWTCGQNRCLPFDREKCRTDNRCNFLGYSLTRSPYPRPMVGDGYVIAALGGFSVFCRKGKSHARSWQML